MKLVSKHSDKELCALLQGSKTEAEAAFAEIYSRYSSRVYGYCLRVLADPDDARDVFQDVFVKFFNAAKHQDSIESLIGFLLTISRNLCLNHKKSNSMKFENIDDFALISDNSTYEDQEMVDIVARSLELLNFEWREIIILRQYQNLSYDEIASLTGSTVASAKNKYLRAKTRLREILQPYFEDKYKKKIVGKTR